MPRTKKPQVGTAKAGSSVPRTPKTSPWAEAADPASRPRSLSRERIRQIERQALFKVAVELRKRGLYPEDLL